MVQQSAGHGSILCRVMEVGVNESANDVMGSRRACWWKGQGVGFLWEFMENVWQVLSCFRAVSAICSTIANGCEN